MDLMKKNFIFEDVNKLKGVGVQLSKYLKKRRIDKIKDILFNLPYSGCFYGPNWRNNRNRPWACPPAIIPLAPGRPAPGRCTDHFLFTGDYNGNFIRDSNVGSIRFISTDRHPLYLPFTGITGGKRRF